MEDINCWEEKFEMCKYATRLLNKITYLNKLVRHPIDIREVKKGIYYARKYHGVQMRQSGDPYYSHPIEVAYMLAEFTANRKINFFTTDMIVTSLLHDTIEDTTLTETMIASIFGEKIASQVEGLTRVKPHGKISSQEMVNNLIIQQNKDLLTIKLFDRVHNIHTINAKTPEKIIKIVEETLETFLILALYLEIREIEIDLKTICTQLISFQKYDYKAEHLSFNNNFQL